MTYVNITTRQPRKPVFIDFFHQNLNIDSSSCWLIILTCRLYMGCSSSSKYNIQLKGAMKIGQSRDMGNLGHKTQNEDKTK
jgi:hypothetical protein